jgi:hypothetical protein|tara:strand:- start:2444 stop:2686 length:243 start_codon:yes stop_codon:yes gene_type:complete
MSIVVNRETRVLHKSANTVNFPSEDWLINPDLSAVDEHASRYWRIEGDSVLLMSESDQNSVDEALAAQIEVDLVEKGDSL